jgi:chromosome segregation ATPase
MKRPSQSKLLCQAALLNCAVFATPVFANPTVIEQEQSYHSLVGLQKEQDQVQKNIDQALKEKNEEIFNYMKLTKDLEAKLANQEVSLKERLQAQLQKRELASRIEDKDKVIVKLRGEISQRDQKIRVLEDKFKKQDEFLKKMVTTMSERLTRTIASLQKGSKMAGPEQLEALVAQKTKLDELLRQGMDHTKSLDGMERQIAVHKAAYEEILQHNITLSETLRTAENQLRNAGEELAAMANQKENMRSELAEWKRYAANLESDFNRKENEFYVKQIQLPVLRNLKREISLSL